MSDQEKVAAEGAAEQTVPQESLNPVPQEPQAEAEQTAVAPAEPVVGEVIAPAPVDSTPVEQTVIVYNGQQVKHRQGTFDADGAELCELADGSTAYVPKSILGE